jgi:tryptophan-rich sensory protein
MGYASYLVYRDGGGLSGAAKMPLALYASQLALNWAWTPLFFGKHDVKSSFYEICALWLNIAACGLSFYAVNRTAGCLSSLISHIFQPGYSRTVLWIRDILVRIRIRGCVPLTN